MSCLVFDRTRERTQDVNFWMKSFLRNIGTALEENLADTEVKNRSLFDFVVMTRQ